MNFSDKIPPDRLKEGSILEILLSSAEVNGLISQTLILIGAALKTSDLGEIPSLFECKKQELDTRIKALHKFLSDYTTQFFSVENEGGEKKCIIDYTDDTFDEGPFYPNIEKLGDVLNTLVEKKQEINSIIKIFPKGMFSYIQKELDCLLEDIEIIVCQVLIALINKKVRANKRPMLVTYLRIIPQDIFSSLTDQEIQQTLKNYDDDIVVLNRNLSLLRRKKDTFINQLSSSRVTQLITLGECFQSIQGLEENLNYFGEIYPDFQKIKSELDETKTFFQNQKDEFEEELQKGIIIDFLSIVLKEDFLQVKSEIDIQRTRISFLRKVLGSQGQGIILINGIYSYADLDEINLFISATKRIDVPDNKITQDFKNIGDLLLDIKNTRIEKQNKSPRTIVNIVEIFLSNLVKGSEFAFNDVLEEVKKTIPQASEATVNQYLSGFKKRYKVKKLGDGKYKKEL